MDVIRIFLRLGRRNIMSRAEKLAFIETFVIFVEVEFVVMTEADELIDRVDDFVRHRRHIYEDSILIPRVLDSMLIDDREDLIVLSRTQLTDALREDLTVSNRISVSLLLLTHRRLLLLLHVFVARECVICVLFHSDSPCHLCGVHGDFGSIHLRGWCVSIFDPGSHDISCNPIESRRNLTISIECECPTYTMLAPPTVLSRLA